MPAALAGIPELIPLFIVHDFGVPGPSFLCRTEVYRLIGPYDESIGSEDFEIYLRLAAAKTLGFVNVAVSQNRITPGSYYKTRTREVWSDKAYAASKHLRRFGMFGAVGLGSIVVREAAHRYASPFNIPLLVVARLLRLIAAYSYHRRRAELVTRRMERRLRVFEGYSQ